MPFKNIKSSLDSTGSLSRGVRVQWSREGSVVQLVTSDFQDDHPALVGCVWADLDRHKVNTLIKTLRLARDEAFGKDA